MRALIVMAAVMALGSCADPVADAKAELETVEKSGGSSRELCNAKRKVAEAYLKSHNPTEHRAAKVAADIACQRADLDGR